MRKLNIFIVFILLINSCFLFTGCGKSKHEELKEKTISELGYVNIKIIDMLNILNNITFENYTIMSEQVKLDEKSQKEQSNQGENSDSGSGSKGEKSNSEQQSEKQQDESQDLINTTEMITDTILTKNRDDIDWKVIKPEIEFLNETWSIIILDLYSLNVDNNKILEFSSKLDIAMMAIKKEDKKASLTSLASLYESLPEFLTEIKSDNNMQKIRQTQNYVIQAYSLADDITNPEVRENLQNAVDVYSEVLTDTNYTKNKTFKTNKAYVLLNELANSVNNGDSDIFYVKYKNFMETINEI